MSRLIARESAAGTREPVAIAAGMLGRFAAELTLFVGRDGCRALLNRATSLARADHPALAKISISSSSDPAVAGITESIEAHGAAPVAAGLESALVSLIELLGRLIGDDLTMKIVTQATSDGASAERPTGRDE